jgi:hypothetical protein
MLICQVHYLWLHLYASNYIIPLAVKHKNRRLFLSNKHCVHVCYPKKHTMLLPTLSLEWRQCMFTIICAVFLRVCTHTFFLRTCISTTLKDQHTLTSLKLKVGRTFRQKWFQCVPYAGNIVVIKNIIYVFAFHLMKNENITHIHRKHNDTGCGWVHGALKWGCVK